MAFGEEKGARIGKEFTIRTRFQEDMFFYDAARGEGSGPLAGEKM